MLAAPNTLPRTGAPTTVIEALEVLPVPPSVEVTWTLLFFTPLVVPVTLTENVQEEPAAGDAVSVPPDKLTLPLPAGAVMVPLPQVPVSPLGVATTKPAGKLSVKATPLSATLVFGFVMVKLSEVVPFSGICAAPKDLVIVGAAATVRFAEAVLPVSPLVEATFPVVLVNCPEAAPAPVTLTWLWLFVAIVAPVRVIPVGAVVVRAPPQTVAEAFATVNPVGNVSLKATPVKATVFAAGLVMVNCKEVVALRAIVAGLNTLAIEGGATTLMLAEAVPPVPPSVEVTLPEVLFLAPAVVPVTSTEKVQEEPAAGDAVSVPPDRLMAVLPAVAVMVPLPQEPVILGVAATTSPAGRVSLKPTPLSALAVFGLVMVKLRVLLAFNAMLVGLKALLIVGGATTVRLAFDVLPFPAFVELAVTLLFFTPAVVPVTLTETVQLAPGASVAPLRLIEEDPSTAVAVPLHVLFRLPGVATTNPAGRLSVNATPFSVRLALVLESVKVRLVVPFSGIEAAPKAFKMLGGLMTVRLAEDVDCAPVPAAVELMVTELL